MAAIERYGPLLGRILMAHIFLISGLGKIGGFQGTAQYIAAHGLPAPSLVAVLSIIIEIGGAVALVIGWKTRWAAGALFIFTLLAALLFHNFWSVPADQAMMQQINFMKNLAMSGGLLYIVTYGAGPLSADSAAKASGWGKPA